MPSCPRCSGQLAASQHDGFLRCGGCGGHLVTPAAVAVVARHGGVSLEMLGQLAQSAAPSPLGCAACGARTAAFQLKGVNVDGCRACGHLWLDAGELARVTRGALEEPPPPKRAEEPRAPVRFAEAGPEAWMNHFLDGNRTLQIKQQRHALETWTGFQVRNQYAITAREGVGTAEQQGEGVGAWAARQFMPRMARLEVTVFDALHNPMFEIHRPFRWLPMLTNVSRVNVFGAQTVGHVREEFSFLGGVYTLLDDKERPWATLRRNLLGMGWTFPVLDMQGRTLGTVKKHWSGWFTEAFTEADRLSITLEGRELTVVETALVLAVALLVDFNHFERTQRRGAGRTMLELST